MYFSEGTTIAVKTLVIEKRDELPKSMMTVEHKLLMLKLPKTTTRVRHRSSMNGAMVAFRNLRYEHLQPYGNEAFPNSSSMQRSYKKNQILREALMVYIYISSQRNSTSRYEKFYRDFGTPIHTDARSFEQAFSYLQIRASKLVDPLLRDVIAAPVRKPKNRYERSLLCVDISDEDLPWN